MEDANFNRTDGDKPEQITGARVSANFFSVLGVQPALGNSFDFAASDAAQTNNRNFHCLRRTALAMVHYGVTLKCQLGYLRRVHRLAVEEPLQKAAVNQRCCQPEK